MPIDRLDEWGRDGSAKEPWRPAWMPRVIAVFVAVSLLLLVAYLAAPTVAAGAPLLVANQVITLVAFAGGVLTSRPGFRRDWMLMLGAVILWVAGNVLAAASIGENDSFGPWQGSVALSATAFVLMTAGVFRLARRDGFLRGATVGLDTTIYALGTGLEWWVLAGQDLVPRLASTPPGVIVASLIPLGDCLLLIGVGALMSSRSGHALSSQALVVAALAGLAGDLGFAMIALHEETVVRGWIPATWMVQFSALGVAALASGRASVQPVTRVPVLPRHLIVVSMIAPSVLGVYAAAETGDGSHLPRSSVPVLIVGSLVMLVAHTLRERHHARTMEELTHEMARTARTDHLTQLPNRRAGDRMLAAAVTSTRAQNTPLAVALVDLDRFKMYNDTYGHQQGDQLLRDAAGAWSSALGGIGTIFRYGGEEFVLILPGRGLGEAEEILATMRAATPRDQSFSAGLAALEPDETGDDVVSRADVALYAAKAAGRGVTITDRAPITDTILLA